jgi:hypothetical protein
LKRKLLVLDLVLLAAIGAEAWHLREAWTSARAREQALLHRPVKPLAASPLPPEKPIEPATASSYAAIAEKMLFSKDRNPTVMVEVAPAPPPKPMPPLPVLYGVMNLSDGTTAIMSEKAGARHHGVQPGDKVGDFTLLAIDGEEITLEWDGKPVTKKVEDMIDRSAPPAPADSSSASRNTSGASTASGAPTASVTAAPPKPAGEAAPGADVGRGMRACQPGDTSPPGTVSGTYHKVVTASPFGESCRWEPL